MGLYFCQAELYQPAILQDKYEEDIIEQYLENKNRRYIWVDTKTLFDHTPTREKAPLGPRCFTLWAEHSRVHLPPFYIRV